MLISFRPWSTKVHRGKSESRFRAEVAAYLRDPRQCVAQSAVMLRPWLILTKFGGDVRNDASVFETKMGIKRN